MADTEDTEGQTRAIPEKKKRKRKKVVSEYVFFFRVQISKVSH